MRRTNSNSFHLPGKVINQAMISLIIEMFKLTKVYINVWNQCLHAKLVQTYGGESPELLAQIRI